MKHINICSKDGYTMEEVCKKCNNKTIPAKPPKFSPTDKYASYRREIKRDELQKKDLI